MNNKEAIFYDELSPEKQTAFRIALQKAFEGIVEDEHRAQLYFGELMTQLQTTRAIYDPGESGNVINSSDITDINTKTLERHIKETLQTVDFGGNVRSELSEDGWDRTHDMDNSSPAQWR